MWLSVVVLLVLSKVVSSQSIIKSLPGFHGDLPFKLETGYVGVGELDDVQLFYYFVESERNAEDDPLVLWLTGGPGCSAFSGFVFEIGPLSFDYENSNGELPRFLLNPYSWTKIANIIFLDSPVGTGFSYAKSSEGYVTSDKLTATQTYIFLRKWLILHPKFLKNPLYIAGDSFSGAIVPIIVQEISNGIEIGHDKPRLNLKGYVLGNPVTDKHIELNSRIVFANRASLVSDEIYESAKRSCNGEYMNVDPKNSQCLNDLQVIKSCVENVNGAHILEATCHFFAQNFDVLKWDRGAVENPPEFLLPQPLFSEEWCRGNNYFYAYNWANDKTVQNALHVRQGTIKNWVRCNQSVSYAMDELGSSVHYHQNFTNKALRVLIYSGDQDLSVPTISTEAWVKSLNLSISSDWHPWSLNGQVGGFTMLYENRNNTYFLTFATVKGGGHTAPEYKPKECFAMIDRWFAYQPL